MSRAEKFIKDYTRNYSNLMQVPTLDDKGNIVPEAHPWLTPDQARRAVEIAREEMIGKVCEYIASNMRCDGYTLQTKSKFIKDLKKAMR